MNHAAILITALILPLAACNNSDGGQSAGSEGGAGDGSTVVKLHPLERFCITYKHTGTLSGTSTQCSRKWGTESYTIEDLAISMGSISQPQKSHKITIGDTIYVIDPDKMTGTRTRNPLYDQLINADTEQLAQSMMAAMQLKDTGEDKQIAGESCNVLSSPMGVGGCYTDSMVALEVNAMGLVQTATSVDLSSFGDDANYALYEQAEITEGPDIDAIMKKL